MPDVIAFDPAAYFDGPVGIREFVPRWRDDEGVPPNELSFLLEWECPGYAEDPSAPAGSTRGLLYYKDGDEAIDYHLTCPSKSMTVV